MKIELAIILMFSLIIWFYFTYNTSKTIPEMIACIDTNIFYDVKRNKIIIKIPFKKSIFLPEILRKNHHPIHLNRKTYQFYEDYVMINDDKILLKKG